MAHNQPTWDFLAGGDPSPVRAASTLRESTLLRRSTATNVAANSGNQDLRAQLNSLQYEVESLRQERELAQLQHQEELREAYGRADADAKRADAATQERDVARNKADAARRDWQELHDRAANEKLRSEKLLRACQEDNRALREEVEEFRSELETRARESHKERSELEARCERLTSVAEEAKRELDIKAAALLAAQEHLASKETLIGELENDIMTLKAQAGDAETLDVVKQELSQQVAYIDRLEGENKEQAAELKRLRKLHKSVEVVQEEKRGLEARLKLMDGLRAELAETQLQKQILEDEKKSWTSYLDGRGDMQYNSPEEMARAFMQMHVEMVELVDKLGNIQPELEVQRANVEQLKEEKAKLQVTLDNQKPGAAPEGKAMLRLQRQKALLAKEVEYLRAQMKTFEAEEAEFNPERVNEEQRQRIHTLEETLEQFEAEVARLNEELTQREPAEQTTPRKRTRDEDEADDVRLGELRRKMRTLQDEAEKLQTRNRVLEAELKASTAQVALHKEASRTRILELRENPTAQAERIKLTTLTTLRAENATLLEQLEGHKGAKVVPVSTLDAARLHIDELEVKIAQQEKKTMRLKQIWGSKALEFREAVCSILGWKLDFEPNGRVKATSVLNPTHINREGEEEENSILFDGEKGTMKVSGGPRSAFAGEIKGLIEFWVEGRKEIPCFLAACTLEFYDRTTRAAAS